MILNYFLQHASMALITFLTYYNIEKMKKLQ